MRTERDLVAGAGKALLPLIAIVFILALVLAVAGSQPVGRQVATIAGGARPSGSANTRVYVTGINTFSQMEGGYFVLQGYVTVANLSNPPNWDPRPNVPVALRMNNMLIHQTPAPGNIVQNLTNGTGNFTLSYRVTVNHTAGNWNITAGLAPSAVLDNLTYSPLFLGTTVYDVNVTANVDIPLPLSYSPDVFFYNDSFSIKGRLLTEGGLPVLGVTVQASFNNTANYTSTLTNGTGHFTINVNPPVNNGDFDSLIIHFPKTTFYNARSVPVPGFKFLGAVVHRFTGVVLASTAGTPTPVNSMITISGRFTYDNVAFGAGDGNVKNKLVRVYWNGILVGTPMTNALGQYQLPYAISNSEPTSLNYTTLPITASLGAVVTGQNGTATFYIRPMIPTRLTMTPQPAWKDERVVIRGILSENEAPTYLRSVAGSTLSVVLRDGAVMVGSMTVVTNSVGAFLANFTAQNLDALNFTVSFPGQGPHVASGIGGAVAIYKTAVFVFNPAMKTWEYPGPPYDIHVFGYAYAQGFGQPDKPISSRQINVYWNGAFMSSLPVPNLDANGYFSFYIPTNFTTTPALYTITLELRGISGTGYSISSSRAIQIRALSVINVTIGSYIDNAVFPDEGLHVDGSTLQRVNNFSIVAFLTYANSTTLRYDQASHGNTPGGNMTTLGSGLFHFVIRAGWIDSTLVSIRFAVNEDLLLGHMNATTENYAISFIDPYNLPSAVNFTEVSIGGVPIASAASVTQGSSVTISGRMVSHLGTNVSFYRVQIIDASTGIVVASGMTDINGSFAIPVAVAGSPGSSFAFSLRTDYNGAIFYTSAVYSVPVVASDALSWILWLIPPIAVGLILLGWVYVRLQKKQEISRIRSYMQQKLDLVRQLVTAGKNREGIAYCYHTLVEVATRAYNLDDVKASGTVREFIEMLVNQKNVPREVSFKFMVAVLDGLYSNQAITQDHVATVVSLLGNLYVDITNDKQETFKL
jgi:hypothetical protein